MKVLIATFHKALVHAQRGSTIDKEFLRQSDAAYRKLFTRFPASSVDMMLDSADEPPDEYPFDETEVELTSFGLRRLSPPIGVVARERLDAISQICTQALTEYADNVNRTIDVFSHWMRFGSIVHVVGAGRALLAASLAANRLAHGGANVHILGDKAPPPNSRFGGGVLAASASGETPVVLRIMDDAQTVNRTKNEERFQVVGIANPDSGSIMGFRPFRELCSRGLFVGIRSATGVRLRGLADLEEHSISQLLDAMVVAAGYAIGVSFRHGHEDLVGGATGPWHT
jgi:hypothetical protein